jgi:hypothetical protein
MPYIGGILQAGKRSLLNIAIDGRYSDIVFRGKPREVLFARRRVHRVLALTQGLRGNNG